MDYRVDSRKDGIIALFEDNMEIKDRENIIYIIDLMKHHIKRKKFDPTEYEFIKKEFEKDVMCEALAYLNIAFDSLKQLEIDNDLLFILDLICEAFEKGDLYMCVREK